MTLIKERFLFSNQTKVRFDDLSYGSHLCHTKLVNIIHNSRALFLKKHELSEIDCFGNALIILNLNVEYLNQCFFDDCLEVSLFLDTLEKTSAKFSCTITNLTSNQLAARAIILSAFFNKQRNKITKVPIEFKYLLESITNTNQTKKD